MERELEHQRSVDARLRSENTELERKLDLETRRNNEITAKIAEIDLQIRQHEELILGLRQDLESLRIQGVHLHEVNA
jgi:hypothetical protein